jgi:ATP-binding cassette subfamily F protein 3
MSIMSLLTVTNVEKSFGVQSVLKDVSFHLDWGRKMGLVGRNGVGKTTLLKILCNLMEADKGTVQYARGIRYGYLSQQPIRDEEGTVYEAAKQAFAPVLQMEERLRLLEMTMRDAHEGEASLSSIMEEYGLLRERFEWMGGYDSLRDIEQVLGSFGFGKEDLSKRISVLSGGEKTRLAVARLLLSSPDILILDEPTNHLDLRATEWLEGFLRQFGGAVLLVSHDRYFLDAVVNCVAELDNGFLTIYSGNFSEFWRQREERKKRQEELYNRQQEEIARLEEFWRRNKAGQNRNMAWSRLKAANRLRENAVERPIKAESINLNLKERYRSGNDVIVLDRVSKVVDGKTLFQNLSLIVKRGDKIGIIGSNGCGKTTFLRILLGEVPPTSGSVRLGSNLSIGYFAQETASLNQNSTVLESVMDISDMDVGKVRNHLARFQFSGDQVFRSVDSLSGGEKNRLALAQIILVHPNLLVLDEPTNHLDIDSREALTEMLKEYDGTLILVSHDRYLLNQVTHQTLEISNGVATLFDGSYQEYIENRNGISMEAQRDSRKKSVSAEKPDDLDKADKLNVFQLSRERKKATKDVTILEEKVAQLEAEQKRIESILSFPEPNTDMVQLSHKYEIIQSELTKALDEWERAIHHAMELGAKV